MVSNNPLISVIIPVYNAEEFLHRCVESVLNNTYKNLEIILVDDGSVDNSPAICDEYAEKYNCINVIHKENGGTAKARNSALDIAKGEYVAFADNDDFIHPDFYKTMISAIIHDGSDIVVCEITRDMDINDFNSRIYSDVMSTVVNKHDFMKDTYVNNWTRNTAPWNKIYKRELFDVVRFPDGKGYEDAFTTYRLIYNAAKISYINACLYYWFNNVESYSSKQTNAKKLLFREEAIRLQSEFYKGKKEKDIKAVAEKFYMEQVFFMVYQLRYGYVQNFNTEKIKKLMLKKAKRCYYKNWFSEKDSRKKVAYFESLHPFFGGILRKYWFKLFDR